MSRPGTSADNSGDPNGLFLDYGIVTHYGQKGADISQSAGRLKGNIKDWENYRQPTVFTTKRANTIAIEWESKSRRLAQLAYEREEGETAAITKTQFNMMSDNYEYIKHPELFNTMVEVREFLNNPVIWRGMNLEKPPNPRGNWTKSAREKCGGYAVSSKLHKIFYRNTDGRSSSNKRDCRWDWRGNLYGLTRPKRVAVSLFLSIHNLSTKHLILLPIKRNTNSVILDSKTKTKKNLDLLKN